MTKTPAQTARERGWIPGTLLVSGTVTLRITAIGEERVLGRLVRDFPPGDSAEAFWDVSTTDWRVQYPLDPKPFILFLPSGGFSREYDPAYSGHHVLWAAWKWEPRPGCEQNPDRYDEETQRNYVLVREGRAAASREIQVSPRTTDA